MLQSKFNHDDFNGPHQFPPFADKAPEDGWEALLEDVKNLLRRPLLSSAQSPDDFGARAMNRCLSKLYLN
jgi:hypothetical protein